MKTPFALFVSIFLAGYGLQAYATPLACDVAMVDGSVDCYGAVSGNDKLGGDQSQYTVNILELFGHADWEALGRYEGQGSPGHGFEIDGLGDNTGSWQIDPGYLSLFGEFMIVFKQGNSWASFLFADTTLISGAWDVAGLTSNSAALSHATLYLHGTGTGSNVLISLREPGTLALIGLGLALFVLWRGLHKRMQRRPPPGTNAYRRKHF